MANATVLALIQQASAEMGLAVPATAVANSNADVVQLLALANAAGYGLQREYEWQQITKEYRFVTVYVSASGNPSGSTITSLSTTVGLTSTPTYFNVLGNGIQQDTYLATISGSAATLSLPVSATGTGVAITFAQTFYVMPSDYDRLKDKTDWDKSRHWEMLGPETGQQWQWLKSGFISTGPRMRYRMLGGFFQIWPPQAVADYLGWEYVSKNWVLAATDVVTPSKASFTVDTDTCIFSDRLMVSGLKHRYFQAKGFGDIYLQDYDRQLSISKANDGGSQTLSMAPRLSEALITSQNLPDSGYGT